MWIVEYAGVRCDHTDAVMTILKAKGIPFAPIGIRPFTTEIVGLEDYDISGKVIAYGSCKLVKLVSELGLRPGVFFDYSTFNAMAWKHFLHIHMANYFSFHSVETLCHDSLRDIGAKDAHFVRPVMDLKLFSGSVKPEGQTFDDFFAEKLQGELRHHKATLVGVAKPQAIEGEWRCFIVNRKLVTGSQYRINGELKPDPSLPEGLRAFVASICEKWLPHDHCTLDVAMIGGEFMVMEFNCINASGLYKADAEKLVDALNSLMV
jgi:hypothetical protein